jgi:hypothetical protein
MTSSKSQSGKSSSSGETTSKAIAKRPIVNKYNPRTRNGQGIVELVTALVCLVPVGLVLIDLGVVAIGAGINDAACRDAARAAASGAPSELTLADNRTIGPDKSPYQRAQSVIKKIYATNVPAKIRQNIEAIETIKDVPAIEAGGAVDGEVSVKTTIDVYPPFIVGKVVGDGGIALSAKHIVPITYVMPAAAP